jgi:hypothetical protein
MMKPVLKTGRKMLWMAAIAERNMPMLLLLQEKDSVKSKHPPYLREYFDIIFN